MIELTPRQREVLNYIRHFIDHNHFSPSYREIMDHFNYKSIGTVYNILKTLKERGQLTHPTGSRRALTPASTLEELLIPLIGTLSNKGIATFTHFTEQRVPKNFVTDPLSTYMLRVGSNDFTEEGIVHNDLLVVEGRAHAENGESVIALLNKNIHLIRKYKKEGNYILLSSREEKSDPIRLTQQKVVLHGVVKTLLRQF